MDAYTKKWAEDFVKDTRALFTTLAKRMEKEDKDLYPMIDRPFKNA